MAMSALVSLLHYNRIGLPDLLQAVFKSILDPQLNFVLCFVDAASSALMVYDIVDVEIVLVPFLELNTVCAFEGDVEVTLLLEALL